jgi:hypothetical protein
VIARSLQPPTTGEDSGDRTVAARTCETGIQHFKLCRNEIGHGSSSVVGIASAGCGDFIESAA